MTEKPLVSVIINCYNGEKYLREAIDSVMTQTYKNWEIIFWDNQSTDSTSEIVKSYHDNRIRYFYAPTHTPLGEARNCAIKQVEGKYMAFLDSDDYWYPDFLMIGVDYLDKDSSCVGFYCNYLCHNKKNQLVKASKNTTIGYHNFNYLLKNYDIGMSGSLIRYETVCSNGICFKKQFDLIEDYDFFLSLAKCGFWIYYPDTMMFYRIYPNSISFKYLDKWAMEYDTLINELKASLVDKGLLDESELSVLHTNSCFKRFEYLVISGGRNDVYHLLRENYKYMNTRLKFKCVLYLMFGSKYSLINKLYWKFV